MHLFHWYSYSLLSPDNIPSRFNIAIPRNLQTTPKSLREYKHSCTTSVYTCRAIENTQAMDHSIIREGRTNSRAQERSHKRSSFCWQRRSLYLHLHYAPFSRSSLVDAELIGESRAEIRKIHNLHGASYCPWCGICRSGSLVSSLSHTNNLQFTPNRPKLLS